MSTMQLLTYLFVLSVNVYFAHGGSALARGFNEDIDWKAYEAGLEVAKKENKMIMLLIHKSWCGACKALKPQFTTSKELEKLSKEFVMINCEDDEEPKGSKFQPDGGYIPRIFFLTPDGEVKNELFNVGGNASYKYYYPNADQVVAAMKRALDYFKGKGDEL